VYDLDHVHVTDVPHMEPQSAARAATESTVGRLEHDTGPRAMGSASASKATKSHLAVPVRGTMLPTPIMSHRARYAVLRHVVGNAAHVLDLRPLPVLRGSHLKHDDGC
jgi:hypothetical protein